MRGTIAEHAAHKDLFCLRDSSTLFPILTAAALRMDHKWIFNHVTTKVRKFENRSITWTQSGIQALNPAFLNWDSLVWPTLNNNY